MARDAENEFEAAFYHVIVREITDVIFFRD